MAKIDNLKTEDGKRYPKLDGWVKVEREQDRSAPLTINYHIQDGPKQCGDCRLAIFDGGSCEESPYNVSPFFDADDTKNPWFAKDGAKYVTNNKGRAAGFIKIFNGEGLKQHACKLVGLFDSKEEDEHAHKIRNAIACVPLIPEGKDSDFCDK